MKIAPITIDQAMSLIKSNDSTAWQWHWVKGKKNCIFELGGRNPQKGFNGEEGFQFGAYIPRYEDGIIQIRSNDTVIMKARIDQGRLEINGKICKLPDKFDLLDFLSSTDFKNWNPKITSTRIPTQWFEQHIIDSIR